MTSPPLNVITPTSCLIDPSRGGSSSTAQWVYSRVCHSQCGISAALQTGSYFFVLFNLFLGLLLSCLHCILARTSRADLRVVNGPDSMKQRRSRDRPCSLLAAGLRGSGRRWDSRRLLLANRCESKRERVKGVVGSLETEDRV